jgi:anti-anti-sigma factor
MFSAELTVNDQEAMITLSGELDASVAPDFRSKIEEAIASNPSRLVLMMQDLTYMASAGLRMLVFAKQKAGAGVNIYVVGAQEAVVETIELTGFHQSVDMIASYDDIS